MVEESFSEAGADNGHDVYFRWRAPAYRHVSKTKGWYAVMACILFVFVLWGYFSESYVVMFTFIILGGVYVLMDDTPPDVVLYYF